MSVVELPSAVSRPTVITEPGLYSISEAEYHGDPVPVGSLSSSGARRLLPPSCPAKFAYERENGRAPQPDFDLGHVAHHRLLGSGPEIVVVDAPDWRTKAAREQRDAAHAVGAAPLLAKDYQRVLEMVEALRRHPLANALFDPTTGDAEQSAFWVDEETGVWRRARFDFLRNRVSGRPVVVDYKTTESAEREHIRRAVSRYGYHQQDPWYLDAVTALGLGEDAGFLFVFQEKTPPYLVTVVELEEPDRASGRAQNRKAIEVYRQCVETGRWPGYADDIVPISLPPWHRTEEFSQ
ncbi:PD-(D/E)XK nuclease-like domain-containing protein [Plantactinospora sp. CA-294935]|uniref:PD-(D/E)XK nuclease-like domain-containing protein n=1 Tax=Plantactinospora sp. CA-294935 TaxID=3240012 RepID=UPI003D935496